MAGTEQVRRAARLPLLEQMLRQHPGGLTVREIAARTGSSIRTVQRDLNVIEFELGVPIESEGRRWKIMQGSNAIGTVRFSLQEARAVFLAARLYLRHTDHHDPDAAAALQKLAEALPQPLMKRIAAAIAQDREKPEEPDEVAIARTLTDAWAASRTLRIRYESQRTGGIEETELDPHLLEATTEVGSTYILGFSHAHGEQRTFRIDRIVSAEMLDQSFEAPDARELLDQIAHGWGVVYSGEEAYEIVIDFTGAAAGRARNTTWHPSQRTTPLPGGGVRCELRLPSLLEITPWIRGWGADACVVAPPELRSEVAASLAAAARQYA